MGTNDLILITFGCTGFLIMIVGFILEKIIEHNHRESEKVIKKYIDECVKANAGTGDKQLTIPDVSNQRELLIAYGEWIHKLAGCKDTEKATTLADSYLSNL